MARIRSIKPEFWTSEQVMECSLNARLLFVGMWNFADDLGRLPLSPKTIKAQIFPSDDMSSGIILGMISELSKNGLLLTYAVDNRDYLQITGWQHQRIDKPQPGKYPGPVNGYSKTIPGTLPPDRKGEDRKGEEKKETREVALSDDWPSDFENLFWMNFPNKVGKPAAMKALSAARRRKASFAEILSGLDFYIRSKPPDRSWLNPATFLNQNRWEDQPATVSATNGPNREISSACDRLISVLDAGFGGTPSQERSSGGADEIDARLLSFGRG